MTQSKTIAVDGARAHYLDVGEGSPVILLHDVPGDARTWRYSIDVLGTGHRVVALDLPGWGKSDAPRRFPYTLDALADHVAAVMAGLGLKRASVVGLGFGGLVAIEHALRHHPATSRLVLTGVPSMSTAPTLQTRPPKAVLGRFFYRRGLKGKVKRMLERGYADRNNMTPEIIDGYARAMGRGRTLGGIARALASVRERLPRLAGELPQVSATTLLVWGEKDTVTPVDEARALAGTIPEAALSLVPHAGHYCHEEMPAAYNGALLRFLKGD